MDDKTLHYRNTLSNHIPRKETSSYCDPSSLHTSTYNPLTPISGSASSSSDASQHKLSRLCQGFVNYDLALDFPAFCDVTKPLDAEIFHAVAKTLLTNGADVVADAISAETSRLLTLNWVPQLAESGSLPPNGYSLLLWPAAGGFRRDLFNRQFRKMVLINLPLDTVFWRTL